MAPGRCITRRRFTILLVSCLLFKALILLAATPVRAWTVSGRVSNSSGAGIAGADLDFEDRNSGTIIFTPNDDTDLSGNYSTTVPTGDYRIFVNPPPGSSYFGNRRDVIITSNTTVDFTLPTGVSVSGYVRDLQGNGLLNVDLNFYDALTGANMGYQNDNTDASGFYSVLVDPNRVYDILYRASPGGPYVAWVAENVSVGITNMTRPDVVLESGFFVSGQVLVEGTNDPVTGADIDARNAGTGEVLSRLGFDNTDLSGGYQVVLKSGSWDILVSPPSGSGLAGNVQPGIVVNGDTFAGTTTLPVGYTLSGTVTNGSNTPLAGVNLDAIDLSRGIEVPSSGDHTNAAGQYAAVIGAGIYDLIFWPPSGTPLAASVLRNRTISGNTSLPTVQLLPGVVISGTVRTENGAAVLGSDIDARVLSSGQVYPTAGDDSGTGGAYSIRIPAGSYRFIARPPAGSGLLPDTLVATVSSNQTLDFYLPVGATTDVPESPDGSRTPLMLSPVFPNPVRLSAHFNFQLPAGGSARAVLTIVAATGRHVRTLVDGPVGEGKHVVTWDGTDESDRPVANGLYFIHLTAGGHKAAGRMILFR